MANKKILIVFHPLNKAIDYLEKGGKEFAPHSLWCYDYFIKNGYEVDVLKLKKENIVDKIGKKLRISQLMQQLDSVLKANHYDLVFFPFLNHSFLLSVAKCLRLTKTKVVSIAHAPFDLPQKNNIKRIYWKLIKSIYANGNDSLIFNSRPVYERFNKIKNFKSTKQIDSWGVDFEFFNQFAHNISAPSTRDYVYATGGSSRDYTTLMEAFKQLKFNLKITTVGDWKEEQLSNLPENIIVDNSMPFGGISTGKIRHDYYNSIAVAVPLKHCNEFKTYGITVVMEGMAMGKPILATTNKAYPFNIEKEKIGFIIDHGDVEGWKQAIQYLLDHPEEAREMGERSKYLAQHQYNYPLFAQQVIKNINSLFKSPAKKSRSQELKSVMIKN